MVQLPPQAAAVLAWIGLALLTVGVAYLFEWRPRPDTAYDGPGDDRADATPTHGAPMLEAPESTAHARELSHDEFDPVGTAVLITMYFLLISGLWLFMYFVEFLGGGPTVVG